MKHLMRLMARIYDLPNAFRVLDIMDTAGCDVEFSEAHGGYMIKPKWVISPQDAKDLQQIILFKKQYKRRHSLIRRICFRKFRQECRPLASWFMEGSNEL